MSVSAFYTGANSHAVETSVTTLLEQAINGTEGMRYMSSNSGNDGSSSVNVVFDLDRNLDIAAVDVQNRASTALGRLPVEVQTTGVGINKNSGSFVPSTTTRTPVALVGTRGSREIRGAGSSVSVDPPCESGRAGRFEQLNSARIGS